MSGAKVVKGPHPEVRLGRFLLSGGVARAEGSARVRAGKGVVASVEVSWVRGRWHIAKILGPLGEVVEWKVEWGSEAWHAMHGEVPDVVDVVWVRCSDDSGNAGEWEIKVQGAGESEL